MTRNPTTRKLAAVAAALALFGLGACGGDNKDSASSSGGTATTTAAAKGGESATGDAVAIKDFTFQPDTLNVKTGTKVTFTNKDSFAHTVTARDDSFKSGNLDEGKTFEQTFDKAGTYDYFCSIHNSMTGKVVVG